MRYVKPSSENEMIVEFIRAELHSFRFSENVRRAINELNTSIDIIVKPNLSSDMENNLRKQILTLYREYGQNKGLFESFPNITKWSWEVLTKDDLNKIRYINYSYWNELSSGTGSPIVAAKNIKSGIIVYDVPNDGFITAMEALKKGHHFAPMILIKDFNETLCIVLEGHVRLTAYALASDYMNDFLCIVGRCNKEDLLRWYGILPT